MIKKIVLKIINHIPFFKRCFQFLKKKGIIYSHPLLAPNIDNKFVGVWILGGIGNQLFQFATGYALSKRMGATLLLDRNFEGYFRQEELSKIGIEETNWNVPSPMIDNKSKKNTYSVITEKSFSFDSNVFNLNKSCYLYGYWQSPKYFKDYENDIRKTINFNNLKTNEIERALNEINKNTSVSVHLRRGDYNTNAGIESFGLLGKDYYERAYNLLLKIYPNSQFYVFSDDLEEAKRVFTEFPNSVLMPIRSACEDMLLMSSCRHHIIANSTFSWWGAWLGKYSDTITIAPRHWFTKEATIRHKYLLDLFPDDWIQL